MNEQHERYVQGLTNESDRLAPARGCILALAISIAVIAAAVIVAKVVFW